MTRLQTEQLTKHCGGLAAVATIDLRVEAGTIPAQIGAQVRAMLAQVGVRD